ncbi:MAG: FAD-dependent oxidoreductase [Phycisphaeraceae bacterium]
MSDAGVHYFRPEWIEPDSRTMELDVCVYGGTAAGVVAACAATRRGRSAILLNPGVFLGGMTSGGLSWTDSGKKHVIGGMSRDFYRACGQHYGRDEEWLFEPGVARAVMDAWIVGHDVPVHHRQFLDQVELDAGRIASVRMISGLVVRAKMFVDATYEGDLLAKAGVPYTVGRESNAVYGETLNGVQPQDKHQFSHPVDPYVEPGVVSSGTLPWVHEGEIAPTGSGDHRIQAYCFRVCLTDKDDVRVAWRKPEGYDPSEYLLGSRWYQSEKSVYNDTLHGDGELRKFDRLSVRHKVDANNHGPFSSDYIGANYPWPEASYQQRDRIFQQHRIYQQGLYWFFANDPSMPKRYREAFARWGLAADEFVETGHWPHQLYVREARRMVGDYVLTEHDCMHRTACDDPVGMGSYTVDSHNVSRFVRDGHVLNEGDVQVPCAGPYGISYRSIVPPAGSVANLAVPVCCSTSHIAFGSVRMEPVFMILAQSAAIAIDLALADDAALQDVAYDALRPELDAAGQVAEHQGAEAGQR